MTALPKSTQDVLKKVYAVLENAAPYEADCGLACDHRCCQGDEHTGMLLFPGERAIMEAHPEYFHCSETADGDDFVTCCGRCPREARPISCRIYPLFPLMKTENGKTRVRLIMDPRAKNVCPIAAAEQKVSWEFRKAVRRGAILLWSDPILKEAYLRMAGPIEALHEFENRLRGREEP